MKVVHLIGGGDVGGAKVHVLSLVKELGKHIDVKIISLRPGKFADDAMDMGIDVEVVKSHNIAYDIKKVIDIVRKGGYQIIHSHGAKANMFSIIAGNILKLPTVTTVHSDYRLDYMHSFLKQLTFGSINSIALRHIHYYIGVSENFRKMLVEREFNPENIFTVYNGMDFNKAPKSYSRKEFSRKYNLALDENDVIVGIAARLYPVKGIGTLINAAKVVSDNNRNVKFVIGGDGEDRKQLERKAALMGLSQNVFFVGWLDDPYELMSIVDISVLTSISESFPYSILEGAKFKKATVSSKVGGIPDLIESGSNGYLFDPGDYHKLAEYILELAADSDKRKLMGERIFEKASSQFSLDKMCQTQLGIYRNILERYTWQKQSFAGYDAIISGYYGFKNIGDDAMLMAIINNLRRYKPDIRMIVLSKEPSEVRSTYGVDSISRLNIIRIIKAMKRARLFIYGGGNLIQDNTSSRSLLYYLGTVWFAKKMGLKVMFYANGIGPLNNPSNIKIAKKVINEVDVITIREKLSLDELNHLNITEPVIELTADPALSIEVKPADEIDKLLFNEGVEAPGPYIGFSVRKFPGRPKFRSESYEEAVALTADYLQQNYGVKPVFIPMQYHDLSIIDNVVGRMKTTGYVIRNRYSVAQTIAIINKMEMVVGMRLHALIFAASQGIPIVGLVYDPKIEGFLQYINQASAGNVRELDFEKLKSVVEYVWNNRHSIKKQLISDVGLLKEKALKSAQIAVRLINN
jgi:polysaccharide pyruvyl transferase CsaB